MITKPGEAQHISLSYSGGWHAFKIIRSLANVLIFKIWESSNKVNYIKRNIHKVKN